MIVDAAALALLEDRMEVIEAEALTIKRMVANVRDAAKDDVKYVVLDNLRLMPATISRVHLALGRFYAAVESAEDQASRS